MLEDKLVLLERVSPVEHNRVEMEGSTLAQVNACVTKALGKPLTDGVAHFHRETNLRTVENRYKQLGEPLKGLKKEEVLANLIRERSSSNTGVSYTLNQTPDGRFYLHNGFTSTWVDGVNWSLHLDHRGRAYIHDGVASKWCEDLFQVGVGNYRWERREGEVEGWGRVM